MVLLKRNLKQIWVEPFIGTERIAVGGFDTLDKKRVYGNPVSLMVNIAPANSGSTSFTSSGYVNTRLFGETIDYDHIILMTKEQAEAVGINEWSKIYTENPHVDFEIKRVAVDQTLTSIAAKRITVEPVYEPPTDGDEE